ncbi:hypothetical protein STEG23_002857, partial [Scotinomys teguina]
VVLCPVPCSLFPWIDFQKSNSGMFYTLIQIRSLTYRQWLAVLEFSEMPVFARQFGDGREGHRMPEFA